MLKTRYLTFEIWWDSHIKVCYLAWSEFLFLAHNVWEGVTCNKKARVVVVTWRASDIVGSPGCLSVLYPWQTWKKNIDCVERAECNIRRCRTVSTYARCWELQSTKELFHYRKKKSCGVSLRLRGCFLWLSVSSELKRPLMIFKAVLNTHDKFLTWQQRCYVSFLYMEKVHVWTKARTEAWILVHNLNNINGVMIQCWRHGGNKDRRSWHWEVVFNVWTLRWA